MRNRGRPNNAQDVGGVLAAGAGKDDTKGGAAATEDDADVAAIWKRGECGISDPHPINAPNRQSHALI